MRRIPPHKRGQSPKMTSPETWTNSAATLREKWRQLFPAERAEFLATLPRRQVIWLNGDFPSYAHEHQMPPELTPGGEPWTTWLILGGRGAGKTRAGAEWVRRVAKAMA